MLIYINRRPVTGPWGGGNRVLIAIIDALRQADHTVIHDLKHAGDAVPDVLFCMDPRPGSDASLLGYDGLLAFRGSCRRGKKPMLLQRVGDVGTHGKPELTELLTRAVPLSDVVIFPSRWAAEKVYDACRQRVTNLDELMSSWRFIMNAPAPEFYAACQLRKERMASQQWDVLPTMPNVCTHHWSDNPKKGFSFYQKLDERYEGQFTYIGRAPIGTTFKKHVQPISGQPLVEELARHDVYVTASVEEAGANHCLEAIAVGLPVIYHRDGGSIPEYCDSYGVIFDGSYDSFQSALGEVCMNRSLNEAHKSYDRTLLDLGKEYAGLIEEAVASR